MEAPGRLCSPVRVLTVGDFRNFLQGVHSSFWTIRLDVRFSSNCSQRTSMSCRPTRGNIALYPHL